MQAAIDEMDRRREKQAAYNAAHGITPETIREAIESPLAALLDGERVLARDSRPELALPGEDEVNPKAVGNTLKRLGREMRDAAKRLEFERAAALRDRVRALEQWAVENGVAV